ncbi:MAG: NPCBM/NEW2 domain-containing protein [Clostridia bacterium]
MNKKIIRKITMAIFTVLFIATSMLCVSASDELVSVKLTISNAAGYTTDILQDQDANGDALSLKNDLGEEVEFAHGFYIPSYSKLSYNDIQEQGYTKLQFYVGAAKSTREENNTNTSFKIEIILDGETVYVTNEINSDTAFEFIDVDIADFEVVQINIVNSDTSTSGDLVVIGEPVFIKASNHPTLEVYDIEFNDHDQITQNSLLQYVTSFDVDGEDLSEQVSFTTNYTQDVDGTYDVTYTTTGKSGDSYSRTVEIEVLTDDYARELTVEELKQPWANYLYHGRNTLDTQGQKVFDLILDTVLDFDETAFPLTTKYSTSVYQVKLNLFEHGIYVSYDEISQLSGIIQDSEPRAFLIPDWSYGFTNENVKVGALVEYVTIWVREVYVNTYDEYLVTMEQNAQQFLGLVEDDMTIPQAFNTAAWAYSSWIKYSDGATLYSAMVSGVGKCNGNSRGICYLAQRVGMKSVYATGNVASLSESHAWSYQYEPTTGLWYLTDVLWGRLLAAPLETYGETTYYRAWFSRMPEYFELTYNAYPKDKLTYPSVWIETNKDNIVLVQNEAYDLKENISLIGSIFDTVATADDIIFTVTPVGVTSNIDKCYVGFSETGDGSNLLQGSYNVSMSLTIEGFSITDNFTVDVVKSITAFADSSAFISGNISTSQVGLYNGSGETYHDFSVLLSESSSAQLDLTQLGDVQFIEFDYGIKDSVRLNTSYGSYGKVQLDVYIDDVLVQSTDTLGWYSEYVTLRVAVPEDAQVLKLVSNPKGSGNNHAAAANFNLIAASETAEYTTHTDSNKDGLCDDCGTSLTENCSCICHKGGISEFFYKIALFFWKIFGINKTCACGIYHY